MSESGGAYGEENEQMLLPGASLALKVTFDVAAGGFSFAWSSADNLQAIVAKGHLRPEKAGPIRFWDLRWEIEGEGGSDHCTADPSSVHALLKRIRKQYPVSDDALRLGLLTDSDMGMAQAGRWLLLKLPPGKEPWKWLAREVLEFARLAESNLLRGIDVSKRGKWAMHFLACALLGVAPSLPEVGESGEGEDSLIELRVTFNQVEGYTEFVWVESKKAIATGRVRCTGANELSWELETEGGKETSISSHHGNSIRAALREWLKRYPDNRHKFSVFWIEPDDRRIGEMRCVQEPPFGPDESALEWLEDNLVAMAEALRLKFSPIGRMIDEMSPGARAEFESYQRRMLRKEEKRLEEEARRREQMARMAEERERREQQKREARRAGGDKPEAKVASQPAPESLAPRLPLPPVKVRVKLPALVFQETAFALEDLRGYALKERAALWWVSNQSDDLLCLPSCRIERLEYQLRTVLRVLGPLRGRALLSDEVGLGKTIEAGLVIKELLTRGMVKRFLVLTVPSLVDQWEEELSDKFDLEVATTNRSGARSNPEKFWSENAGIVASLHTLKQPAHLAVARQVHWDILIVDEAHYLRNRDSQAWQAVNSLSRQFLLLLTATPVQNSLEELYNLVTLLQPGQLPTPKEFRARFVDPKRPRQPREPEELRRLLGQVMIRNTRANAGIQLPPRRAETVLFTPDENERIFWQKWETEFRAALKQLNASEARLWGRLLLQAAGSSPAAWRGVLEKFPDKGASRAWREQAPLEGSWRKKCELIPPLTRIEGGAVIFTQFLETQSALAEYLRSSRVETFVINGSTPAPERQPITEQFRKSGGALLLTHSGTEGRNLQFCHRLANFDLPWNPMEIEQRIGRLHRLGQQHPVRIYNFVQAGTLQEHLLEILQEKLNLFELVVGETGLVLGERFSSDEFAEEIFKCWQEGEGRVAEALAGLGNDLAAARDYYAEVKKLDETLFAKDYESV